MFLKPCLGIALTLALFVTTLAVTPPAVYVAKLTAGDAVSPIEIENSLGSATWSHIENGRYRLTCSQCFPDETKIYGLREYHFVSGGKWVLNWDDENETSGDSLILQTFNRDGNLSDNILIYDDFKVVVYP